MYCGQCGKKVMENMLFCPFCGSPIVIPDQDEVQVESPVKEEVCPEVPAEPVEPFDEAKLEEPEQAVEPEISAVPEEPEREERPVSLFERYRPEEKQATQREFVPLSFDFETQLRETDAAAAEPVEDEAEPEEESLDALFSVQPEFSEAPRSRERRPGRDNRRPEGGSRRNVNTYVPVRDVDPDNMFMDEVDADGDDDYDLDDKPVRRSRSRYRDEFEYEEPEYGGFFQRHIRGIVGLILMLILAIIFAVWMFSPKGQLALARVNLAWTAQPYASLGHDAYDMDSDLLAAKYFEKAYARDNSNYEYAHSAMVAYYEAEEIESAAAMLKKCVEMAPDNPEPYQEMLILYPNAQDRPWEITELIRLGYQRTGHEALKLD
ncbi:MAG: zinc ribbon domain-containing protein [Clostridia bacterium]|nr:zinc ribbon domain-containing protein [Clostridia bacterium]